MVLPDLSHKWLLTYSFAWLLKWPYSNHSPLSGWQPKNKVFSVTHWLFIKVGFFVCEQAVQVKCTSSVNNAFFKHFTLTVDFVNLLTLGSGVYGVLYYAGHGFDDGGESFLLPVDADLKYDRQHSLRAQEILQTMQTCNTELNLLIIDSCRIR